VYYRQGDIWQLVRRGCANFAPLSAANWVTAQSGQKKTASFYVNHFIHSVRSENRPHLTNNPQDFIAHLLHLIYFSELLIIIPRLKTTNFVP
jgi:hypothetical protein